MADASAVESMSLPVRVGEIAPQSFDSSESASASHTALSSFQAPDTPVHCVLESGTSSEGRAEVIIEPRGQGTAVSNSIQGSVSDGRTLQPQPPNTPTTCTGPSTAREGYNAPQLHQRVSMNDGLQHGGPVPLRADARLLQPSPSAPHDNGADNRATVGEGRAVRVARSDLPELVSGSSVTCPTGRVNTDEEIVYPTGDHHMYAQSTSTSTIGDVSAGVSCEGNEESIPDEPLEASNRDSSNAPPDARSEPRADDDVILLGERHEPPLLDAQIFTVQVAHVDETILGPNEEECAAADGQSPTSSSVQESNSMPSSSVPTSPRLVALSVGEGTLSSLTQLPALAEAGAGMDSHATQRIHQPATPEGPSLNTPLESSRESGHVRHQMSAGGPISPERQSLDRRNRAVSLLDEITSSISCVSESSPSAPGSGTIPGTTNFGSSSMNSARQTQHAPGSDADVSLSLPAQDGDAPLLPPKSAFSSTHSDSFLEPTTPKPDYALIGPPGQAVTTGAGDLLSERNASRDNDRILARQQHPALARDHLKQTKGLASAPGSTTTARINWTQDSSMLSSGYAARREQGGIRYPKMHSLVGRIHHPPDTIRCRNFPWRRHHPEARTFYEPRSHLVANSS
ncbi:uncharacterized protein B0H18DRAFT_957911 [Fomitopsis serialis]|uniref:uncharacterized protein n=1 Tax=Fomitopsis serialis TaxID=139415 RepID=UPI002008DE4C|nr:uncharacterized protein B0H18DRAFT_957911 [Neoantrodia serialis]KAH9918417.1 hypothetical protein B0H18DRAFT_957911 [Neoantrodia serialis]